MEDQVVTISRVKYTHTYPDSFMMIAAMNPCPCGYYGQQRCRCTDYEVLKYRQKISGPILDRIDIQKHVQPVEFMKLSAATKGSSSKELRERVETARIIQRERFRNISRVNCNAQMSPANLKEFCELEDEGQKLLQLAFERFNYSARSYHKFLKVARTFADMENSMGIGIVGSRRCTEYGKTVAKEAAEFLSGHRIPVISGMAKGIDSYSQTACLNA